MFFLRVFNAVLPELIKNPIMSKPFAIGHGEHSIIFQLDWDWGCRVVKVDGVDILDQWFTVIRLIHSKKQVKLLVKNSPIH